MSLQSNIFDALKGLVGGTRVYPDIAPPGVVKPYITYQQVGGQAVNFLEGGAPSLSHARVQINVWAATREAADTLALSARNALMDSATLRAYDLGAHVGIYEPDTKLFGATQDFGFWY